MSLRIWLPLTKDLRNQGLDDVTVTNNGAIFNSTGKLGGSYEFNGSSSRISCSSHTWTYPMSICAWFKPTDVTNSNTQYWLSYNTDSGGTAGHAIGIGTYGGKLSVWFGGQVRSLSTTLSNNVWYHIIFTIDANKKAITYLNGEQIDTTTFTANNPGSTWFTIGARSNSSTGGVGGALYFYKGYMNDVRFYDHCLSLMEVKEISKGLILHYPLNRNGWGNNNILVNTHFDSRYTQSSGWNTEKNGTQLATSWGGYNGGVSNPSTVYHAHLKQVNNEWVYEYIRTADESWLGISQGGLQLKLIAGKTYTFSWEEYRIEGNNYPTGGLYYFKTGATSANFHLGQFGGSNGNVLGKWRKFSYTFIAPTDGDYSKNMSWYIYGQSGGNGKMYMRHPKLEEGSVATPWCPNSSDELATTLGMNNNIEYDCSGFCNNGEIYAYDSGGKIEISPDTPKYNVSTHIASANPTQSAASGTRYLYGHCELTNPTQMSVAFWLKPITGGYGSTTSNGQGYFCTTNYEYGNTSVGSDYQNSAMNHRDGTVDMNDSASTTQCRVYFYPTIGEWHHYVYTYDGQVGRGYKDGVQTAIAQFSAAKTLDSFIGVVIGFSKAGGVWRRNDACYSDFRIYASALSADDVKSLYQNSAYIDNQGNIYGAVYEEV